MLTITYDSDFNGMNQPAGTIVEGTPIGMPVLVQGRLGQALKSGPSTGYVEYPTQGVITPAGGTVEMWVCPIDWGPDDQKFHVFFEASGEGALYLYKYWETSGLLMLTRDDNTTQDRNRSSAIDIGDWKPGEWHHIAGTWSAYGVMCYVDGKPASQNPAEGWLPKTLNANFRIGDHPWQLPRTSASLVDEVRLYDRPLSPAHIAAHYQGNYDFTVPLTEEGSCLRYDFYPKESYPERGDVEVRLSTGGADTEDARLRARLAVVSKGDVIPLNAEEVSFVQGQAVGCVPFVPPEPGEYDVAAEVLLDGSRAFELRKTLIIPTMEWKGNQLGLEDRVLPPWDRYPLKVRMRLGSCQIQCWGRKYDFNGSPLPTQITSSGETLLSRPMSLLINRRGKTVAWTTQSIRVVTHSDTCAELAGIVVGKVGRETIRFKACITAEYDGMLLIELSCETPEKLALVDSMSIDIALKADRALYLHRWVPNSWPGYSGRVPEEMGVIDHKTAFVPYAWLGDNDRGLFWFCESDEYWPNSESEEAIQISNSSGEVQLRLNLVARGQALLPNWRFAFGLQATPVKPLPRDWRKWRLVGAATVKGANVAIIWPSPTADSLKHFGYPEAMDPVGFESRVANLHTQGMKAAPYLCLVGLSGGCPEWPYFRKWAIGPDFSSSADVAAYGESFRVITPLAPDWSDFIVWKSKQFIECYGIDGVYHDLTEPWGFTAEGCGYVREGKVRPTYPILAFRTLYRRMYAVLKSMRRTTFTMAHESGKVMIPVLAYDDSHLDGEHFMNRVKDNYMDVMSLDAFRAEFMGRQWGPMPFFLPVFGNDYWSQDEPTRGMMALLMLHDVSPWAVYCKTNVLNDAWAALDEFGYADAGFLPYFDPRPPATFDPQPLSLTDLNDVHRVIISAYQHADKRTLLIIANLDRALRTGKLRIDFQRLGLNQPGLSLAVMSWPGKQPLTLEGNVVLPLDIPGLDYRMIVVEVK